MRHARGQTAIEYATVVAIVSAALLGMAIYVKRAISGQLRSSADSMGQQYHPTQTTSTQKLEVNSTTISTSELKRDQDLGIGQPVDVMEYRTEIPTATPEKTTRTGTENVGPIGTDVWN